MNLQKWFNVRQSRRQALRQLGLLGGASLTLGIGIYDLSKVLAAKAQGNVNPINHVLVACQENRSFDEYFGYYGRAQAFGAPAGYAQPDGKGGSVL